MARTISNHLFGTRMRTGILITNSILVAMLSWWTFGWAKGPAQDTGPPPSPLSDRTTIAGAPVPSRKTPPDLSDLLRATQGFASRMDGSQGVRPNRRNSLLKPLSRKGPAFDWKKVIVRGVVSGQGTDRYAIIEYANTGEQVLMVEGGWLQNGAVLAEIGETHLVFEVDGQRRTAGVSLQPPRRMPSRNHPRSFAETH